MKNLLLFLVITTFFGFCGCDLGFNQEAPNSANPEGTWQWPFPSSTNLGDENTEKSAKVENGRIEIFEEITDETFFRIIRQLDACEVDSQVKEIQIFIYSPGGSAVATFAICDAIRNSTKPVATISLGFAASGAAMILASGTKGKRYGTKYGDIMIHRPYTVIWGYFRREDLAKEAKEMEKLENKLYDLIAEYTGKSVEEIKDALKEENWLNVNEAIKFGLIDKVWRGKKSK